MRSERSTLANPVIGMCLIIIGALFLLGQLFSLGPFWPLLIVAPGVVFLYFAVTGGRSGAPLAIPGVLITGTGAILLYQSLTTNWQSWAYVWTLYPALLGAGIALMGHLAGDSKAMQAGRRFILGGLTAFVAFAALFEVAIFQRMMGGLGWPLLLIALGIGLLLAGARRNSLRA